MSETSSTDRFVKTNGLFIVGAAKSGTTTLHGLVAQHPEIAVAERKEPEHYSDASRLDRGLESYLQRFDADRTIETSFILDASVAYSQYPFKNDAATLIKRDFPDARIVYIVRDPVDRWISHYGHLMRRGDFVRPETMLKRAPRLLAVSSYGQQIQRYIDAFGRANVLILTLDELSSHPTEVAHRVFQHAGLAQFAVAALSQAENAGGIDHYVRNKTSTRVFAFPGGSRLRTLLPASVKRRGFQLIRWSIVGKAVADSRPEPTFSEQLRADIRAALGEDMKYFERLSGISFPES